MNFKRFISLLSAIIIALLLITGCGRDGGISKASEDNEMDVVSREFNPNADFEQILEEAGGGTVNFYGWGGDENRNKWLRQTVAPILKERYDITLEVDRKSVV